jgi:hypothetical protein
LFFPRSSLLLFSAVAVSNLALVAAVIYPPNDVRAIVDQMAKHIATSSIGAELEQRVRVPQHVTRTT